MSLAWHIAALDRYPRDRPLPDLKGLLARDEPAGPQTPEQQLAVYVGIAAAQKRIEELS